MNHAPPTHAARAATLLLALLLPALALAQAGDDQRPIYRDLVARHADAVVTVKYVMSVTNSGNEQRIEDRTQGILVAADGLILIPERAVRFDLGAFSGSGGDDSPVAQSSDFRVRLAGSEDWLPADLVTRDGELGLAWLRLREGGRGLDFVDLSQSETAEPGMTFYSLLRTSDEWGGVPVFRPGLVLGETRTPTFRLLVDGVPGIAFSAAGRPLGYVDIDLAALTRSRGAGIGLDMADMVLSMIPAAKVAAATAQAAALPVVRPGE